MAAFMWLTRRRNRVGMDAVEDSIPTNEILHYADRFCSFADADEEEDFFHLVDFLDVEYLAYRAQQAKTRSSRRKNLTKNPAK